MGSSQKSLYINILAQIYLINIQMYDFLRFLLIQFSFAIRHQVSLVWNIINMLGTNDCLSFLVEPSVHLLFYAIKCYDLYSVEQ